MSCSSSSAEKCGEGARKAVACVATTCPQIAWAPQNLHHHLKRWQPLLFDASVEGMVLAGYADVGVHQGGCCH